jgi:hypothetical protein
MKKTDGAGAIIQHSNTAYEPRDVNPRALFIVGIGILISAVIINFSVRLTFGYFAALDKQKGLQPSTLVRRDSVKKLPEPALQIDPADDLKKMRAIEASELHSYAWVDQQAGVVRIPIEQAMKVIVERGLPSPAQPGPGTQQR